MNHIKYQMLKYNRENRMNNWTKLNLFKPKQTDQPNWTLTVRKWMLSEPKAKSLTPSTLETFPPHSIHNVFRFSERTLLQFTSPAEHTYHTYNGIHAYLWSVYTSSPQPTTHTHTDCTTILIQPKIVFAKNMPESFFFWNYYFKFHIFFFIKVLFVHFWCSTFFHHY